MLIKMQLEVHGVSAIKTLTTPQACCPHQSRDGGQQPKVMKILRAQCSANKVTQGC